MSLPQVVIYNLAASNATSVVNAQGVINNNQTFTLGTTSLDVQRRLLITTTGNESSNTFVVKGTNQAGMPIVENVAGVNNSTTQTNLDFKTVVSITALGTTAATVSVGTDGAGSSLWQILNWHATPTDVSLSAVIQTGTVNYTMQYCYDDPNNLPTGVAFPTPFNMPTLTAQTANADALLSNDASAWRILLNSGTGTVRATGIQGGIGTP